MATAYAARFVLMYSFRLDLTGASGDCAEGMLLAVRQIGSPDGLFDSEK